MFLCVALNIIHLTYGNTQGCRKTKIAESMVPVLFFFGVCLFSESVCDYCIYFILGHKILEANLQKGRTTFIRYEYNKYRSQNDSSSILYTEHGDVNTSVIMIYRNNAEKSIIIQFVHVLSQYTKHGLLN
jgi:hypothetical protein